jgi:hypothetical protein
MGQRRGGSPRAAAAGSTRGSRAESASTRPWTNRRLQTQYRAARAVLSLDRNEPRTISQGFVGLRTLTKCRKSTDPPVMPCSFPAPGSQLQEIQWVTPDLFSSRGTRASAAQVGSLPQCYAALSRPPPCAQLLAGAGGDVLRFALPSSARVPRACCCARGMP